MLPPRYVFRDDYAKLYDYFVSQPHDDLLFRKGEQLWSCGVAIEYNYYIKSGLAQVFIIHANGQRKIASYHGEGTVFPGIQKESYKIESSTVMVAITDMQVMRFRKEDFYEMVLSNRDLAALYIEWISKYVNLFVYESAHQQHNFSMTKLCNLLYLLSLTSKETGRIAVTQEELAEIIGTSRVNVTKNIAQLRQEGVVRTHRNWIELCDAQKLQAYCSDETQF